MSGLVRRRLALAALAALLAALLLFLLGRGSGGGGGGDPSASGASGGGGERGLAGGGRGGSASPTGRPSSEPRYPLRGRVILPDETPVEGAVVTLLQRPTAQPGDLPRGADLQVKSGPDGSFVFPELLPGGYALEAVDGATVSPTARVALGPDTEPITLVLFPGASLTVKVIDAAGGKPIAGARVRVTTGDHGFGEHDGYVEALTDGEGLARVRGISASVNHLVIAGADGYAEAAENAIAHQQPRAEAWSVVVRLRRAAAVSGRVVDASGNPVAGARVGWEVDGQPRPAEAPDLFDPFGYHGRVGAVFSDADGQFRLAAQPGPGCVLAMHPRHELGQVCALEARLGSETSGVLVVLRDGARLGGVVLSADGAPVAGATVIATRRDWKHMPMFDRSYRFNARTDADGRFEFEGVKRVPLELTAFTEEASSTLVPVDLTSTSQKTDVVIRLEHAGVITGQVVEASGKPVPYAGIEYWVDPTAEPPAAAGSPGGRNRALELIDHPSYALPRGIGATLADAEGRFRITALPPGLYTVKAQRATRGPVPPSFGTAQEGMVGPGEHVKLTLPGVGAVSGKVLFEDGAPATTFAVSLALASPNAPLNAYPTPVPVVSEDGSFVLSGLPAGRYSGRVEGPRLVSAVWPSMVVVRAGETADLGTIRVAKGTQRQGLVVNAAGESVAGAQVTIAIGERADDWLHIDSDEEGRFTIPPVKKGHTIELRAEDGRLSSGWVKVPSEQKEVRLEMTQEGRGSVAGVLVDPAAPVDRRLVSLTAQGKGTPNELPVVATGFSEADGRFRLADVQPGSYLLWVKSAPRPKQAEAGSWFVHPTPVRIEAFKETALVVQIVEVTP